MKSEFQDHTHEAIEMKKTTIIALFATSLFIGQAGAVNLDLEPCINGEVSASGTHVSDAQERMEKEMLSAEPCIYGEFIS